MICMFKDFFRNICLKICELDPAKFPSTPGLPWKAALKKTKLILDLLTDIDMSLMIENGIRFINMQKLITNTWKNMIEINNRHMFNVGI